MRPNTVRVRMLRNRSYRGEDIGPDYDREVAWVHSRWARRWIDTNVAVPFGPEDEAAWEEVLERRHRMKGRSPTIFQGWLGLGDTIYYRPAARAQAGHRDVYVETAWPELFSDLDVGLVRPNTRYRTQRKNIRRHDDRTPWVPRPGNAESVRPGQRTEFGSVPESIVATVDMHGEPYVFDLPDFGPSPIRTRTRPLAVLRPVTHRREWLNIARSPDPAYVATAATELVRRGYYVVSVADVDGEQEWIEEPAPTAGRRLHHGELKPTELLALVQHADLVVGGVGWIVPACVAMGTPLIVIGGGYGHLNNPDWLMGPLVDGSRIRWLLPDDFCMCADPVHDCPKDISEFDGRFAQALGDLECA